MVRETSAGAASRNAAGTAPAPWTLTGSGYVVLLRRIATLNEATALMPPALRHAELSGPSVLMYVDYGDSPVGPYRELLFIPGRFRIGAEARWSISRIVVSSEASVVAGRNNWGIPKERADFDVSRVADGGERIVVEQDGRFLAELSFRRSRFRLPVTTALLPESLRAMYQYRDAIEYRFAPSATGTLALARLRRIRTDATHFASIRHADVIMAWHAPRFRLGFPIAELRPRN